MNSMNQLLVLMPQDFLSSKCWDWIVCYIFLLKSDILKHSLNNLFDELLYLVQYASVINDGWIMMSKHNSVIICFEILSAGSVLVS